MNRRSEWNNNLVVFFPWNGMQSKSKFSENTQMLDLILYVIRKKEHEFTLANLAKFYQKDYLKHAKPIMIKCEATLCINYKNLH